MNKFLESLEKLMKKHTDILHENIGMLHEFANYLLEHETITGKDFMKISYLFSAL